MNKIGQDKGYAMAALLIVMSVAAIMMTVAMPAWKQMTRREKEEELVFRGQQYVRAIRLYGMKFANANPPSIDLLVEQRYLRKKFKDPITNDDFQPILAGQAIPGSSGAGAARGGQQAQVRGPNAGPIASGGGQAGGRGGATGLGGTTGGLAGIGGSTGSGGPVGGVMGVMSKSKDASIKIYNGRNHYNEWAFVYVPQVQAPGVGGVGGVGGRGQPQPQQPNNPFGTGIGGRDGRGGRGANPNLPPQPIGPGRGPTSPIPPIQPGGRGRGL